MAEDEDRIVDSGIGAIEAALQQVISFDVDDVSEQNLPAVVLRTEQLLNAVHTLSALLLERFERDGGWASDGALSAAAWTAQRTGSARAGLRSRRRQGAVLTRLPAVSAEARMGRLSTEHLSAIGDCVRRHPDLATHHEAFWLQQAEVLHAEGFRLAGRHWLAAAADAESPDRSEPGTSESDQVSSLHVSRTFEGCLRIDGVFTPGDAELVEAALDAGVDAALRSARDGDPSVTGLAVSALRAGVLVDLLAQTMRHEPSDASAPDRYRVAVVVQHGQATTPAADAACDASAYRVVLGAQSEVLDVGRQTSRWPVGIRRAITLRDRGCTFPGCDRPPSWTDIHHCTPWNEDGTTSLDNGALICRRHHSFIHRHRWRVTIDNDKPITRTADGTPFAIRRWQPDALAS